jgi:hypothetical protein
MAVTTYTNFLGRVVREDRGGTVRDYQGNPLGSTPTTTLKRKP